MFYSVKYRRPGQFFYRKLKNVKGDGIIENGARARFFILMDETRVELPFECEFVFSRDRFQLIHKNAEKEAGQSIPIS